MTIGEVCNREVVIMGRSESVLEAARQMREQHVGDVVIVEERLGARVPVGILSDRDLVIEVLAKEVPVAAVAAVAVGDIMSDRLLIAHENDEIQETVRRMRERGVRRIPVVSATGSLVGILALDDLVELIAEQLTDLIALMRTELRRERATRTS
jgi:CBS domain-containing protein